MDSVATSKNLTALGIATIVAALAAAAVQFLQGGIAAVNVGTTMTAIMAGVGMIMAKGQASTGGTVPQTREAFDRLKDYQTTAPSEPLNKVTRGFAQVGLLAGVALAALLVLALSGCAGVSALQGSTGPIAITTAKDPVTGQVVATSSINLTTGPAILTGGACLKPVSAVFTTLSGQTDSCHVQVPLKPAADGTCP